MIMKKHQSMSYKFSYIHLAVPTVIPTTITALSTRTTLRKKTGLGILADCARKPIFIIVVAIIPASPAIPTAAYHSTICSLFGFYHIIAID